MTATTAPPRTTRTAASKAAHETRMHALGRLVYALVGVSLMLGVWYLIATTAVIGSGLVPRPDEVAGTFWTRLTEKGLLFDTRVSVTRVVIGVAIGSGMALPVGFLLAWHPTLRAMFEPLVNFFRALPPIALIPLMIVYFGIGETSRISILAYASFFSAVVVLFEGISSLDPVFVRAARVLGANSWEVFAKTVVPAAIPHLFTAIRVALGVSWATVVAAELIAAERGLGAVIQDAGSFFQITDIYVGIVTIGLSALVMDYALKVVQRRATRWQEKSHR